MPDDEKKKPSKELEKTPKILDVVKEIEKVNPPTK